MTTLDQEVADEIPAVAIEVARQMVSPAWPTTRNPSPNWIREALL